MNCTSYVPSYYQLLDLNKCESSFSSHPFVFDGKNGEEQGNSISLLPFNVDEHLGYDKVLLSQIMQKHEATFRYQIFMAAHAGGAGPVDGRTHIWVQDDIFMPDHNKVVRFITSRFALETCDEGHSWRYVTPAQCQKKYRWNVESSGDVEALWYRNVATLYHRTIHSWRTTGEYPATVTQARWGRWTAAWHDQAWQERAGNNKVNRSSEQTGAGTGTSKHIADSKTYSAHYHSMQAAQGADPTSWDLYLHAHRCLDGSFVDERSRLVNQNIEALRMSL